MAAAHRRSRSTSAARTTYWRESARPLTSLVFVAPILIAYECGVLFLGAHAARNGADVWLRTLLDWIGFGQYCLLPLLTCSLLLAWHHTRRETWQLQWSVLSGMFFESMLLGTALLALAQWQAGLWQPAACAASQANAAVLAKVVAYCGAGIYEELLFRLSLLPLVAWLLRTLSQDERSSVTGAVLFTSALFAAAHYQIDVTLAGCHFYLPAGEVFAWSTFCFRFLAGLIFATLFVKRGFGIAVGAHALYDILAALL